jgi:hypothetical protein
MVNSCFCYNKEGKRIFGFDWYTTENRNKMKCRTSFKTHTIPAKTLEEL